MTFLLALSKFVCCVWVCSDGSKRNFRVSWCSMLMKCRLEDESGVDVGIGSCQMIAWWFILFSSFDDISSLCSCILYVTKKGLQNGGEVHIRVSFHPQEPFLCVLEMRDCRQSYLDLNTIVLVELVCTCSCMSCLWMVLLAIINFHCEGGWSYIAEGIAYGSQKWVWLCFCSLLFILVSFLWNI